MTALKVSPGIMDIAPYVPGRSRADGGTRIVRLASNETPLGTSPLAEDAYRRCAGELHRYPDGGTVALREAIARHHGLDPDCIICGNGSDELLYMLAAAFSGPGDEVIFGAHAFAIYRIAAQVAGARPVAVPEQGLTLDVEALIAAAGPDTRLCFLANPNNPTGTYIPASALARLRDGLPDHCLLVIDAAYAEYMPSSGHDDYTDGADLVAQSGNVVMTRTFSKIYGLSALRLGWLFGPSDVVGVLNRVRSPFNINRAAQAAGIAALEDTEFVDRAVAHNARWRPWLESEMARLGLVVHPSAANFVLVEFPETPGRDAGSAYAWLLRNGIIPRAVGDYGLPSCLRFSLGLEEENRMVIDALGEFMGDNANQSRATRGTSIDSTMRAG